MAPEPCATRLLAVSARTPAVTALRAATGLLAAALAATLTLTMAPSTATAAAPAVAAVGAPASAVADNGAKVLKETVIGPREVDLLVQSPSVGTTTVRLLLPRDWAARPDLAFPTLYLYHGGNEPVDYRSWVEFTDVEGFTADKNVLIAMPSDGMAGYYTDRWDEPTKTVQPQWETFHTQELPQLLTRGYRSNGRFAAGGISIGGYGALIYAARHPGFLKAAASYSGLVNTQDFLGMLSIVATRQAAGLDPMVWGSPLTNQALWQEHNPSWHPQRLKGTKLFISAGDGTPGPLDNTRVTDVAQARIGEFFVRAQTDQFVKDLKAAGVPVTADLYTGGWHNWGYWERGLQRSWPLLTEALGAPTPLGAAASSTGTGPGATVTAPRRLRDQAAAKNTSMWNVWGG